MKQMKEGLDSGGERVFIGESGGDFCIELVGSWHS